jgi:shikimate kinase
VTRQFEATQSAGLSDFVPAMNLLLIGYRGTGKSAVAQQLGLALGWDWVDADVELELRAGRSIAAIFADDGEAAFRDLESAVLADLVCRERTVIALGGGVVLRSENQQLLRDGRKVGGKVVWLTADPDTIHRRLAEDPVSPARRPPLTAAGGLDEINRLLAHRTPLYQQCAELVVDTVAKTPAEVAAEILRQLPQLGEPA